LEGGSDVTVQIGTFVALGDSFTEGLDDPRADQRGYLGWADRFAQMLATQQPGLRYANLALRGKRLAQVADGQVPQAVAMAPDLVSLAAGGNDLLGLRSDPDALAQTFNDMVGTLVTAGCRVLIFTGYDPRYPVLRLIRGKVAVYNAHLRAIAAQHGCDLVDLWAMAVLRDPRALSADRLHLTPAAHHRVALRTCEVIGAAVGEDWRDPWPAPDGAIAPGRSAWLAARRTDLRWAQAHAAPWVARRLRGVSSGDGLAPKRPELAPL
jgi:lysophospholipase L1-like esterase